MAIEIERKFLVRDPSVVHGLHFRRIDQGYLVDCGMCVRVRLDGRTGVLTLKGRAAGLSRAEFEYEIPFDDARELLDKHASLGRLTKLRHELPLGNNRKWEIDVYEGPLHGLVTAEIELESESQHVDLPFWLGAEVTHDERYSNANLAASQAVPR